MLKYAFAHPGKIGDLLYCLPTVHAICKRDNAIADIYTSAACKAAKNLIEYQEYVKDFIIPNEYVIQDMGQGIQPWFVPVFSEKYDAVFQLGYKHFPQGPLHLYIAHQVGLETVPDPHYDCPDKTFYNEPYIVVAHCGHRSSPDMIGVYQYFMENCPVKTVQVGIEQDWIKGSNESILELDLLDVASLIKKSSAFVGFYSAPLAIANGFPGLSKIITMWPGVGEQHGLHIPITIDLSFPTGPILLKTVMDNL